MGRAKADDFALCTAAALNTAIPAHREVGWAQLHAVGKGGSLSAHDAALALALV